MAKKARRARKAARRQHKAKAHGGKSVGKHGFGGRQFDCYGKRVKAGGKKGSTKRVPRIFCARTK